MPRTHAHVSTQNGDSLAHAKQAEATAAGIAREADPVVFDAEPHLLRSRFKLNAETLRLRVLRDIVQRFLHRPVHCEFNIVV